MFTKTIENKRIQVIDILTMVDGENGVYFRVDRHGPHRSIDPRCYYYRITKNGQVICGGQNPNNLWFPDSLLLEQESYAYQEWVPVFKEMLQWHQAEKELLT